jgi:protein-arginine kinase activator protein McsA
MDNSQVKSAQTRSEDHSVIIDISNNSSESEEKKYFCSHCNSRLAPFTQEDKLGCYLCIKCQMEYWPKLQPVKKANRFETPGPATNEHGDILGDIADIPMVAMDTPEASSTLKQKLPAAYEALGRHGFRWITFDEK